MMNQNLRPITAGLTKIQPTMLQLAGATGSNYGEEWTIKLQAGITYHVLELETNLKHLSTIEKVTIDINGTPVCYASGARLELMDKALGKFQQEGRLIFDLSKFEYRSPAGIYQTQLATELTDDVTVTIKFGARNATGADAALHDPVSPTLRGKAWVTNTDKAGRVFSPDFYELVQHSAAAGEHTWIFPNGSPYKNIQRMVFDENEVKISQIKVKRGSRTISTIKRSDLDFQLQRYAGITPQDGHCILDFTLFGFGTHGAINSQGLSFELEVDGAGAIKTYVEGYTQQKFRQVAM